MKLAIHQPQYWPWAGYVQKILAADVFVYLDNVQYSKNGYQNRNQIKSPQGATWLTLPVRADFGCSIEATEIADASVLDKHMRTLAMNYAKAPGYIRWREELEDLLTDCKGLRLGAICFKTTEWMLTKLGVTAKRMLASELVPVDAAKSKLVAELCRNLKASTYLTGSGATDYMQREDFAEFDVVVQRTLNFEYKQQHPKTPFIAHLSTLDLLLNEPDTARELLERHCQWEPLWQRA